MSDVLEDIKEETTVVPEEGEHDLFSHYVKKADILEAQINNKPCLALCGKEWVPTHDEEKYPICPACKDIYEGLTG